MYVNYIGIWKGKFIFNIAGTSTVDLKLGQ